MNADAMDYSGPFVLDISDQPILERGVPAEDEHPGPWLGAMLRAAVSVIMECAPGQSWEQTRDALDAVTWCIREDLLPQASGVKPVPEKLDPAVADRYLTMACPAPSEPVERGLWARALGHTVLGIMMSNRPMPVDDVEFDRWWVDIVRGLDMFSAYVRSEGGPLTWTTGEQACDRGVSGDLA